LVTSWSPDRSKHGHNHDVVRFSWELVPSFGGEPLALGFDVALITDDDRIGSLLQFLDRAPGA
jgi:hypothetical protein